MTAIQSGGKLWPATQMGRNEMPHMAERPMIWRLDREVMGLESHRVAIAYSECLRFVRLRGGTQRRSGYA
jgi:hypothetical protein